MADTSAKGDPESDLGDGRGDGAGAAVTGRRGGTRSASDAGPVDGGTWVSVYAGLDRLAPAGYRNVVFGGPAIVGALVLLLQLYARSVESFESSTLSAGMLVVGASLSSFGFTYYAVRSYSSCRACGAAFSKRRLDVRHVRHDGEDDDADEVYLEAEFECSECGHRTTEPSSYPETVRLRH